jgi:hypothetical protein
MHWHGATPTTAMPILPFKKGSMAKAVDWLEKVTDEQYTK